MQVDGEGDKPTFSAEDLSHISPPAEGDAGQAADKGAAGAPDAQAADKGAEGGKPAKAAKGAADKGAKPAGEGKPAAAGKEGESAGGDAAGGDGKKGQKEGAEAGTEAGAEGDGATEDKAGDDKAGDDKSAGDDKATADAAWPKEGFPDDWRERIVASLKLEGDALKKAQDTAKRAASPGDLLRSVMAAASRIQEASDEVKGRPKLPTGKDDKPEDVKAFQKAWGVPETPEGYKLPDRPKDLGDRSEEDLALIAPALERFQKAHFSQAQQAEAIKILDEAELTVRRARAEAAKAFDEESEDALRTEWGTAQDYKANMKLANDAAAWLLGEHFPEQADREEALKITLDNGRKIGSYPGLVKTFAKIGRMLADDGAFVEGEPGGAGKEPEARMAEIAKLMHTGKPEDEAEYKRLQPEMQRLARAVDRRKQSGRG
jgi:hypothetical protein